MSEQASVTTREAVLASLLAHACIFIFALLFPGAFNWSNRSPSATADPEDSIPIAFLGPPAGEPPGPVMGDAGRVKSSERRPADAPPPTNDDPYSVGNTRNRFVAPRMPRDTTPAPQPGSPGEVGSSDQGRSGRPQQADRAGEGQTGEQTMTGDPSATQFHLPQPPERGVEGGGLKGDSLRDALGKMSVGMSGGAPLKFDNPTGGLSSPLGGLSFDTPGFDWGPYARKIYWVIWTNWTRGWPPAAWAGLKGIVTVRFTIWKDGRISDITVVDSSGTPAFDICATLALEASSPLPPLPADFPKESEGITARFLYNTDAVDR